MNTICQDRTRKAAALLDARIDPHHCANARNGYPLAAAGMGPQQHAGTRKSLRKQVGKSFANWTPLFANWIQLANPCQLHSHINQALSSKLASWQVGKSKTLPTCQLAQTRVVAGLSPFLQLAKTPPPTT